MERLQSGPGARKKKTGVRTSPTIHEKVAIWEKKAGGKGICAKMKSGGIFFGPEKIGEKIQMVGQGKKKVKNKNRNLTRKGGEVKRNDGDCKDGR